MSKFRALAVTGIVCLLVSAQVQTFGSGTSRKDTAGKNYKPGSCKGLNWFNLDDGIELMAKTGWPGMVYFYNARDKQGAYRYEVGLLGNKRFKDLDKQFVCIKTESKDKQASRKGHFKVGRTGISLLHYDGTLYKGFINTPSTRYFDKTLRKALNSNKLKAKKAGIEIAAALPEIATGEQSAGESAESKSGKGKKGKPIWADVKDPALRAAMMVYDAKCGACHEAYEYKLEDYTRAQWEKMMAEMGTDHGGEVVKLTKKEGEVIKKYVLSKAKAGD